MILYERKNIVRKLFIVLALMVQTFAYAQGSHQHGQHQSTQLSPMQKEYADSMQIMHEGMAKAMRYQDADTAFAAGMLPHHEGAVEMAKIQLKYGKDPVLKKLAQEIIQAQESEINLMKEWLKKHNVH